MYLKLYIHIYIYIYIYTHIFSVFDTYVTNILYRCACQCVCVHVCNSSFSITLRFRRPPGTLSIAMAARQSGVPEGGVCNIWGLRF